MSKFEGLYTETDILAVGSGAGGLLAALSAKRNSPRDTRVTLVDSWMIGRTGHTAFSNAWTIVALPDDDIDRISREIVAGNGGIADHRLIAMDVERGSGEMAVLEALIKRLLVDQTATRAIDQVGPALHLRKEVAVGNFSVAPQ